MAQSNQDIQDQIDWLDVMIPAMRAAIQAFIQNGAQKRYRFDSSREIVDVEREDFSVMYAKLQAMMNERQILCQRIGQASGTVTVRSV